MNNILVVDDEPEVRYALREALIRRGYEVDVVSTGDKALELFSRNTYNMVISDLKMPGKDGVEVLKEIKKLSPLTPVLLITAFGTVEKAVEAVKEGAVDFLIKPFSLDVLEEIVEKAVNTEFSLDNGRKVLTNSQAMKHILSMAKTVARSDATVLITGESGTGKELLARFIHQHSPRKDKPFVAVNCAAIPENLLESELFGHERGAFTGAVSQRCGKFEQANYGTILLDEISEMDIKLQAKLLRVLQEKEVERVGGARPIPLNIRIIATTNRDLKEEVKSGRFREDLYYRLNIFPIHIPPLRERREDIAYLAEYFVRRFAKKYSKHIEHISEEALALLKRLEWKGNVRELENTMERAVLLAGGTTIDVEHIFTEEAGCPMPQSGEMDKSSPTEPMSLSEMEKRLIYRTLEEVGWNRTQAAKILGISVRTLRNKLKEYGQFFPTR